jgi:hypothetical protein
MGTFTARAGIITRSKTPGIMSGGQAPGCTVTRVFASNDPSH